MKRLAPYALVAAAWLFVVAYAYPGILGVDSIYQLHQARTGDWGNWHPPAMAVMWGVLDRVVAGPLLVLLLQVSMFTIGLFALTRRYFEPRMAAIITAAMLVFPPVFGVLAIICKDALMAGALLCGAAGLLSDRRPARVAGWVALLVASMFRHNAALLVVPLVAMIAPMPAAWPAWRQRVLAAAAGIAIAGAGMLVDRMLTRVDEHPFANMLALPDVCGTIAHAPDLSDDEVRTLLAGMPLRGGDHLQAHFRDLRLERNGWESLALGDDRLFDLAETDAQADAIVAAWKRTIAHYPAAYTRHRLVVLARTFGWGGPKPAFAARVDEDPAQLATVGEAYTTNAFQRAISRVLHDIRRWPIFSPLLYLILSIGLLVRMWHDPLQRSLLAGTIVYAVSLIVLSPGGHDYRYVHWLAVTATFASLVWIQCSPRHNRTPSPAS